MKKNIRWFVEKRIHTGDWFLLPTISIFKDFSEFEISFIWLRFGFNITRYDQDAVPF